MAPGTTTTNAGPNISQSAGSVTLGGVVRSCLSGDTLVVRPRGATAPNAEKILHIAGITAPRMGNRDREDEVRMIHLTRHHAHPCISAIRLSLTRVFTQACSGTRSALQGCILGANA